MAQHLLGSIELPPFAKRLVAQGRASGREEGWAEGALAARREVGPEQTPRIVDREIARRDPFLAVLSARAHGNDPDGLPVLLAVSDALEQLDAATASVYAAVVFDGLKEPARRAMEKA